MEKGGLTVKQTIEDVNREYEETIRPHKETYDRQMAAMQAMLDAELTKIHDRFKEEIAKLTRMRNEALTAGDKDRVFDVLSRLEEIEEKKRQAQIDADVRYRKMSAPVKAEYGRATEDARNRRMSALSGMQR